MRTNLHIRVITESLTHIFFENHEHNWDILIKTVVEIFVSPNKHINTSFNSYVVKVTRTMGVLKTPGTIGNCQRPFFSLAVSQLAYA